MSVRDGKKVLRPWWLVDYLPQTSRYILLVVFDSGWVHGVRVLSVAFGGGGVGSGGGGKTGR